jgi:alkanesulfonate monooxygenase
MNPIEESGSGEKPKPLGCLDVFATSPQSLVADRRTYLKQVAKVAQWSEKAGCIGTLVYTDNSIVDPWLVAQVIIENTEALCPLVAVQPIYMHPYSVAKMITSLAFLYNRRVYLNMVAGGFKNDLTALNDQTPHDKRYDRLIEYTKIIQLLLASETSVSFDGEFYKVDKLVLKPPLPSELLPEIFVSGSSPAGVAAADSIGATAVKYPEPPSECAFSASSSCGVRVGIIARASETAAWEIAHQRFPNDRKGQITHELAMRVSDSSWHKQLSELGRTDESHDTYWLGPFNSSKSNCPYLVGDYEQVATELRRYIGSGYRKFILDIPASEEELHHIGIVFRRAVRAPGESI